jgi:hypothetical protein
MISDVKRICGGLELITGLQIRPLKRDDQSEATFWSVLEKRRLICMVLKFHAMKAEEKLDPFLSTALLMEVFPRAYGTECRVKLKASLDSAEKRKVATSLETRPRSSSPVTLLTESSRFILFRKNRSEIDIQEM